MNVDLMKRLDVALGPPLVKVARGIRHLSRRASELAPAPRRILVMKFWGLGSLVQATASFRALRARYPEAELDLLTIRGNEKLFEDQGLFHEILTLDLSGVGRFLVNSGRRLWQVRRKHYDFLLNYEGYARFGIVFSNLSHAGTLVGYHTKRGSTADVEVEFREGVHISEVFGDLSAAAGAPVHRDAAEAFEPRLRVPRAGEAFARNWRRQLGIAAGEWVVAINVNAGPISPARRWPRERFTQLAKRLLELPGARVILIGGPDEIDYVAPVETALGGRAINLAGRTTLAELLALLADVDLLITNDTGPLHLAVGLGTPTVCFYGPESPDVYGPRGEQHQVLYRRLACSPCLTFANLKRTDCDHFSCLRDITVDDAWAGVCAQRARREVVRGTLPAREFTSETLMTSLDR